MSGQLRFALDQLRFALEALSGHCALYLRSTLITSCDAEPRAMLMIRRRARDTEWGVVSVTGRACQACACRRRPSPLELGQLGYRMRCVRCLVTSQGVTPPSVAQGHGACLGCAADGRHDLRGVSPYLVLALTCAPALSSASAPTCGSLSRQRPGISHLTLGTEGTDQALENTAGVVGVSVETDR